ncbi:outer membrane usher protein FimD/PapC [Serratia fonticola]|jgi:outer membrane usher protein PapC|uniref:Outer membrane usher protein FimD/PapC n=1 Tax=Serratia fonticola TaxID=47917 RepID=A0A559T541_SERFO|nr:fimbria/pilus outer membrane usher protein [Serratia fonticola]TQI77779.1 outer membrane usher protein FimD/PapC [Serratia fonticola]TQI95226.1 outer membrane usher protein FimD/PapC [Serratia fonticola]TVZ69723.1 outer membrane usher protein FimD/PapC [Serratia fonticola]
MSDYAMTSLMTRKKTQTIVILSFLCGHPAFADTEFNTDVLDIGDRSKVDLSRFSDANYVMPGTYLLDIKINQKPLPQRSIQYLPVAGKKNSKVCLPPDLIEKMALKERVAKKVTLWHDNQCADISAIEGATISDRIGSGVLAITIPQAWMKYTDPDWTPPEQWDDGIPGLLLDYSISGQVGKQSHSNSTSQNFSSYGTLGANLSSWRLRADYQSNFNQQAGVRTHNFDWNQIYAYRALPMQAAKLTVGEIFLDSNVFDSYRFTGVNLASDERMLPPSLQGYAPEVRGIAKSNAKVTVLQEGRTLYQTTVPAGPFVIQDLNSSVRGRLDVRVEEQDGSVSTFQVDTATIPYLTRPGYVRYNIALGRPSTYSHNLQGPFFSASDFSWGMSNAWSLYGGALLAGDYNAWALGLGRDLNILGAMSVDVTQSFARLPDEPTATGMSFKVNYAKRFDDYNSQITFAGYRFSQRKFMSMAQYLQNRYNNYDDQYSGREKELYTITASKTFMAQDSIKAITAYLTYSHQTYWDARAQNRYGLSASKMFNIADFKNVTASLAAFRTTYHGKTDDSIMLNFTVPIGDRRRVGYSLQTNNSDVTQMASYNDYTDPNNTWQLSSGFNQDGKPLARGYYSHNASFGSLNANASYQQDNYSSVGGTFRSGITATRYGIAAHQNNSNGGSRLMLDTDGIAGIPINNGRAYSNDFGLAVISDITSYYNTDTRIDVNKLADDVEATRSVVQGTLTEGAIGYRHFEVVKGSKLLAVIKLADGSEPPFGATVLNEKGREMAVVSDEGSVYLTGVQPNEKLDVAWEGQRQCRVVIPGTAKPLDQLLLPCSKL